MVKQRAKIENRLKRLEKALRPLDQKRLIELEKVKGDPVAFAKTFLSFTALPYQEKVLADTGKRIAVRMSRQAGKTTTIAVRAIWYAATHPRTLSLIVAPCLTPDTPVITKTGVVRAESVREHDLVLTHKGRWRAVTGRMTRPYNGDIYVFRTSQGEVKVTPEHRLYVDVGRMRLWITARELYDRFKRGENVKTVFPKLDGN